MTMTELRHNTVIGTQLLRREDPALLTGEAKFTNDLGTNKSYTWNLKINRRGPTS